MSDEIRIFISYAREDQARVRELYDHLVDAGYHPWLDREHIRPGQQWEPIIKRALKQSHFALVCLSATSINKRGFLQKEIKQALEQALEKFEDDVWLIPARLDDCDVPEALAHIQWVDLFDDDGLQQLLAAMEYQLRKEKVTPPSAKPVSIQAPIKPSELKHEIPQPLPESKRDQEQPFSAPADMSEPKQTPAQSAQDTKPKQENPYSPINQTEPKTKVVNPFTRPSQTPSRSLFTKTRVGLLAGALALMALLGNAIWSQMGKSGVIQPPATFDPVSGVYVSSPTPAPTPSTTFAANLADGVTIEMVNLPGGEFTMGANDGDGDEKPLHQVKLSPFAIGRYEVTQRQWKAVMNDNPSRFSWSDDLPVENVSWTMVQDFLGRLNGKFRLPTEAEWEYAARAGSLTRYSFEDDEAQLHNYAWFWGNSNFAMQAKQTHPVGRLKPNEFGLFDMHGNVWEWCSDWYSDKYYQQCKSKGIVTDPPGPSAGSDRVIRGGSWGSGAVYCRSAYRAVWTPGDRFVNLGFRLVRIGR